MLFVGIERMNFTPKLMHWSSLPGGNLTMNFDPALSSASFKGRKRHTTRILSSPGASLSADMITQLAIT